ncbi:conserved hypothetical protein [Hyella patelloides LEGE 07179]|uniref:Uncharacterized protein n=1 Tax=Hyella patelloides LEGE 07179 TaxID=945734 RepID=A0A563VUP0_9CYAN|nr:conserved hypothetical protein [Hyella patelloides LEGE 07179]
MEYGSITLLIPLSAAVYLMTIYAVLKIAENLQKKRATSSSDIGNISN